MTILAEIAQSLWDLLDRDGFDTNVVLILADCLEEQGSPDRLWEGLRTMVHNNHQPYYSKAYREYWWMRKDCWHPDPYYTSCLVTDVMFKQIAYKIGLKEVYSLIGFSSLSEALCAYTQVWAYS